MDEHGNVTHSDSGFKPYWTHTAGQVMKALYPPSSQRLSGACAVHSNLTTPAQLVVHGISQRCHASTSSTLTSNRSFGSTTSRPSTGTRAPPSYPPACLAANTTDESPAPPAPPAPPSPPAAPPTAISHAVRILPLRLRTQRHPQTRHQRKPRPKTPQPQRANDTASCHQKPRHTLNRRDCPCRLGPGAGADSFLIGMTTQ